MKYVARRVLSAGALLLGLGVAGAASAQQPLDVIVQPVATVVRAPFVVVGSVFGGPATSPPVGTYNPRPLYRHARGFVDGVPVVRARVIKLSGPRYRNPPNADWSRPVVLTRGATVPDFVPTIPVRNRSVAGMMPGGDYDAFVAPRRRVVFLEPATREVVRIVR